jgi:pathogenesis-related protein 1
VGVGPLQWSAPVAQVAQNWADHLAGTSCGLVHSKDSGYGENLFMGTSGHYGTHNAVNSWESEKKDYQGGVLTPSNWYPSGHYTQVVWQNTKRVGCAQSSCNGSTIVVCNYDPPGNRMGQAPY